MNPLALSICHRLNALCPGNSSQNSNLNYLCLGGRAEGSGDLGSWAVSISIFLSFWKGLSVVGWLSVGLTLVMQMPFKGKPAKSGSRVLFLF